MTTALALASPYGMPDASITFGRTANHEEVRRNDLVLDTSMSLEAELPPEFSTASSIQSRTATGRFEALLATLQEAIAEADRFAFELPSELAMNRIARLLFAAVGMRKDLTTLDIAVGEDGSIEVTMVPHHHFITLDVSPSGSHVETVVRNVNSGELVASTQVDSEFEFLRWMERGA